MLSQLETNLYLEIVMFVGWLSSVLCWIFVLKKLKLNPYIKMILLCMTLMNSVCTTIAFGSSFAPDEEMECQLFLVSTMSMIGTYQMNSLISYLRYRMAKLASKAKIAKKMETITFIFLSTISAYSWIPLVANISQSLGYVTILSSCEPNSKETLPKNPLTIFIVVSGLTLVIGVGLICNISMIYFVSNTNSQQNKGTIMIPWKSTNSKMNEDLQIPVRATLTTTLNSIVIIIRTVFVIGYVYSDSDRSQTFIWSITTHYITACTLPIFLVLFSVKQQTKVNVTQPPAELQFHD